EIEARPRVTCRRRRLEVVDAAPEAHARGDHEQKPRDLDQRADPVRPHRLADADEIDQGDEADEREHERRCGRRAEQWYAVEEDDRKSTRLNSSHVKISYAVFC